MAMRIRSERQRPADRKHRRGVDVAAASGGQSYHSDCHYETIPAVLAREIIVIIVSAVSFVGLGGLNVVTVAVIGRGERSVHCAASGCTSPATPIAAR